MRNAPERIMMRSGAKTYRNISAKIRFLGLEIGDWGALAAVAGIVFAFSHHLVLNMVVVGGVWWWMRMVKAAKPEGYTMALIGFWASPKRYLCDREYL